MVDEVTVEKSWEHNGYHCEVRIMPMGHRCGYVFVEKSHPLYGVDAALDGAYGFDPDVNGGLTYSQREGDSWVFGFDFAHCWDIPDPKISQKAYEESPTRFDPCARVATLKIAVHDCESLADTLKEWEGREFVYNLDDYYSEREPDAIICHGVRYEKVNA